MVRVYIGWDQRDATAFEVCKKSLLHWASIPVEVIPLKEWELRAKGGYWRAYHVDARGQMWDVRDGKPFSTNFSFTRFCVPWLEEYRDDWVVFCDADMLWQADIADLMKEIDKTKAVCCVKHDHRPEETSKMDGVLQTVYSRKNWSSFMVMNPSRCRGLTPYAVNNQTGSWLHAMCWVQDDAIGALEERWNWLEGWSPPHMDASVIHYTRGTPDMNPEVQWAERWFEWAAR